MTIAYQHRPLSKILAPAGSQHDEKAQTAYEAAAKESQVDDVPEKYRGKSAKDIIEMHQNSEKRLGQIQNEVGQLRGLVSDLSQIQRASTPVTEDTEDLDLSGDELLQDPVGSMRKVVQHELKPMREEQVRASEQGTVTKEANALITDFPKMEETVASQEFLEFVQRTPSRLADQNVAATSEGVDAIYAARRLLEDFDDFQKSTSPGYGKESPVEKAKKVANEGSGSAMKTSSDDLIHESDVITLINSDPDKYRSPSFQKALLAAIREGRYVKNG
jgi:hypothetical protein